VTKPSPSPATWETFEPILESPYPRHGTEVVAAKHVDDLHLARGARRIPYSGDRETEYVVDRDYVMDVAVRPFPEADTIHLRRICVPRGMLTDLASVPRGFRWLVSRAGKHLEAAVVHDWLYIAWQDVPGGEPRKEDWRYANRVFWQAMKDARVPWQRRWPARLAVGSFFGWLAYRKPNKGARYARRKGER